VSSNNTQSDILSLETEFIVSCLVNLWWCCTFRHF